MTGGRFIGTAGVSLAVLLCACAPAAVRPQAPRYALEVSDDPDARQFRLSLRSLDSDDLCLDQYEWPTDRGRFTEPPGGFRLRTANAVLQPAADMDDVYCPGGCGEIRLAPHATIAASVRYDTFGDPDAIARDAARALEVTLPVRVCRAGR